MILTCLEIIQDYGLRSIGLGERVLPKTDITICHQATLIGSGMLWNIYFGVLVTILVLISLILSNKEKINYDKDYYDRHGSLPK